MSSFEQTAWQRSVISKRIDDQFDKFAYKQIKRAYTHENYAQQL